MTFGQFLSEVLFAKPIKFPNNSESEIHIISGFNQFNSFFSKKGCDVYAIHYVAEISNLLHELIKDDLITTIAGDPNDGVSYIGNINKFDIKGDPEDSNRVLIKENGETTHEFISLDDGLWHYSDNTIRFCSKKVTEKQMQFQDLINICPFITPDLRQLVKDDFKTIEDKTLKWTRVAAIVSFIGMLSAISLPFLAPTNNNNTQYESNSSVIDEQKNDEIATISTNTFKELPLDNTATN